MRTKKQIMLLVLVGAVAAMLLCLSQEVSAQAPGMQPEGAWLARGEFSNEYGDGTFPFIAHFHQDGTWSFSTVFETAGAGPFIPPPFRSNTALTGTWKRVGARKVSWVGLEIVSKNPEPGEGEAPIWFYIVGIGSHEISPGDPDHAAGSFHTLLYACAPDPESVTGFKCPTWDEIDSGTVDPLGPAFPPATFKMTRIR